MSGVLHVSLCSAVVQGLAQACLINHCVVKSILMDVILTASYDGHVAGVAENSSLRKQNYFYYNCLTGKFLRDNCPAYLKAANFARLKAGLVDNLTVASGFFLDELRARQYSKVGSKGRIDLFFCEFSRNRTYSRHLKGSCPIHQGQLPVAALLLINALTQPLHM